MKVEYGATAQMGERAAAELQPLTHNSAVEFEVETDASEGAMTFTFGGKVATFVLLSGAVVSMVTMPSMFQGASFGLDDSTMDLSSKMSQVTLKASNEYTEMHGYAGKEYDWLDSGSLVEPHKQTTLTAFLPAGVSPSSVHMHWHAGGDITSTGKIEAAESNDGTGWQIETVFPVPGQYVVEIDIVHLSGAVSSAMRNITCRYVRREIRSLSYDDRNRFFDAAEALMNLDKDPTIAVATNWTRGLAYYVRKHLRNAVANKRSDRMHDGMGFLTQHLAITSDYERALQAMDAQVCLPYWDFTIDAARYNLSGWEQASLWDSDLWTADWFGNSTGESHMVEEGRWAYQETITDDDVDSEARNAYGWLRAPWNLNPSKHVTRYHKICGVDSAYNNQWPSCAKHHYALKSITEYSEYVPYMAYEAHGQVHALVGGTSGCYQWYDKFKDSVGLEQLNNLLIDKSFSLLRGAWREGLCESPEYCSSDTPEGECKLLCKGCDSETFSKEQLNEYQVEFWLNTTDHNDLIKEQMVREVYCTDKPVIMGDQIEGSSPVDISFWPIHPTLERLTVYKNMKFPFTNTTWYSTEDQWNGYCKWGETFAHDLPGNNTMKNDYCSGHYKDDLSAFEVVVPADAVARSTALEEGPLDVVSRQLSNGDIMNLLTPGETMYLPYVYDSFTWDHCEELGFDFSL